MSASPLRADPYGAFNFLITLVDSTSALDAALTAIGSAVLGGFSECSGLEMGLDVEEYREGGNNGVVLRFPTRMKTRNLVFKNGIAESKDLFRWLYGFSQGQVKRRDGIIALQDDQHVPVWIWSASRMLPVRWTGPALNAAQSQIAIQELEIAHEGLTLL